MTTIINTPGGGDNDSSSFGLIVGIILTLVVGGLFVYFILPTLRNNGEQPAPKTEINIEVPAPVTPEPAN